MKRFIVFLAVGLLAVWLAASQADTFSSTKTQLTHYDPEGKMFLVSLHWDSSYADGGETISMTSYGSQVLWASVISHGDIGDSTGYFVDIDPTNFSSGSFKVKLMRPGSVTGPDSLYFDEVPNTTNVHAFGTTKIIVYVKNL